MDDKEDKVNRMNIPNIVINQINVITNDSNTTQQELNHHQVETNQSGNNVANVIMDIAAEDVDEESTDAHLANIVITRVYSTEKNI